MSNPWDLPPEVRPLNPYLAAKLPQPRFGLTFGMALGWFAITEAVAYGFDSDRIFQSSLALHGGIAWSAILAAIGWEKLGRVEKMLGAKLPDD